MLEAKKIRPKIKLLFLVSFLSCTLLSCKTNNIHSTTPELTFSHLPDIRINVANIVVLNDISFSSMKTKLLQKSLNKLPIGKSALFVGGEELDQNFNKALKNIPMHDLLPIQGANVYDILRRETLVLSKSSVEALVARLANKKEKVKIKKEKK